MKQIYIYKLIVQTNDILTSVIDKYIENKDIYSKSAFHLTLAMLVSIIRPCLIFNK